MKACERTVQLVAAAMGRDLERDEALFLKEHAAVCPECREHLAASDTAVGLLKGGLVPQEIDPPTIFNEHLRERLRERAGLPSWYRYLPQVRLRPFELGFLTALLLLAVGAVTFFYFHEDTPQPQLVTQKEVATDTPLSIDLEYLAVHPIAEVTVTIELDEGVAFHSDYREVATARAHTWKGRFKEGINSIPFMVTVEKPGIREIRTHADIGEWRHEHRITLTSNGKTLTMAMFRLPKRRI